MACAGLVAGPAARIAETAGIDAANPWYTPAMRMKSFTTVPAYIAAAPKGARGKLRQLRAILKSLVPKAEEKISYGMMGYKYLGRPLVYFGAFKDHVGFYPASSTFLKRFAADLRGYGTGKGTVRFPHGKPLPVSLIRKLIRARIRMSESR